ncbi:uncharacterized protein at2g24330 [Phtheirospermum japonicum]|uniref:Uncharacterized protein at2g24330 n=1 Tax=Phtheirospermum japonicum TaxID=374723 RepID=A0A830B3M4_9LAMI|nr:uncharacterized protein at2g24330 [Phtheirospermum japonicum]
MRNPRLYKCPWFGHQHAGGVDSTLYGEGGREVCSSSPIYGTGDESENKASYIVGMSTCYPSPGSLKIYVGEMLTLPPAATEARRSAPTSLHAAAPRRWRATREPAAGCEATSNDGGTPLRAQPPCTLQPPPMPCDPRTILASSPDLVNPVVDWGNLKRPREPLVVVLGFAGDGVGLGGVSDWNRRGGIGISWRLEVGLGVLLLF